MSQRRPKRSNLWFHFKEGVNEAVCEYCSTKLSTKSGSLGNLKRHMATKHPTISLAVQRQPAADVETPQNSTALLSNTDSDAPATLTLRQPVNVPLITNFIRRPPSSRKTDLIDKQVVAMVTKGHHSLRMVEEPEFRKLIDMVSTCPGYQLPTRKTFSQSLIPKTYKEVFEACLQNIKEAHAICLCTDGWTSSANQSYIAVTAHYIDNNTKLKSILLGCINYNERHTSANLTAFIRQIIQDWQITNKICCIVSDNAANILSAVRLGEWRSVGCFAHLLNLVVQDSLKTVAGVVNKVKAVVDFFKRSAQAQAKLETAQKQMNLPLLKLKQECPTRWNSCFDMLERILKIKDAVISTIALTRSDLNIQTVEWDLISKIVPILRPFYEVTLEISAEQNVSLSKVLICTKLLSKQIVQQINTNQHPDIAVFLNRLNHNVNARFRDFESNTLYADTAILDPRFKQKAFRTPEAYRRAIENLRRRVAEVRIQVPITPIVDVQEQLPPEEPVQSSSSIWEEFDVEMSRTTRPECSVAAGIKELDKYLLEEPLNRKEDPLKWWHSRKHIYPHLYTVVLSRLCIQATSVSCERVFSSAGQVISDRRRLLKPSKITQMLFLNHNM
ncbi:E3 SUMO-protein ligase ZBED1-like [Spodoptera frugiperda]|uniref:E3 SUMO-protein ligase ZBED1-like n=1 Tax=Spodoptera frugiperda TaxID=7108 RepID=A0A9R0F3Y0_SPOFR|nr:E3 SUMO-protein ligase ZBED1-like [Spodoptera frugiperda]